MQHITALIFFKRSTTNYHIYESTDGGVVKYVRRTLTTRTPPDVLVDVSRTPTQADAHLFPTPGPEAV